MSTHILFEHPLNEKMRTWLRIEFLIQQLSQHLPVNDHATALHFFRNVGDLLDVIEDRYEQRSTLIVSQLPVKEWYGLMENPTVADALLDRLIHNAHRIELSGESQRKKSVAEQVEVS